MKPLTQMRFNIYIYVYIYIFLTLLHSDYHVCDPPDRTALFDRGANGPAQCHGCNICEAHCSDTHRITNFNSMSGIPRLSQYMDVSPSWQPETHAGETGFS